MTAAGPGLVRDGLAYRISLARHRVPLLYRHVVMRIDAEGSALAVTLGRLAGLAVRSERRVRADVVCLGYGFQPANEILRALGAAHDHDPTRGHLVTRRGDDGETTLPGVYGVGDCCGLGGARAAALEEGTAGRSGGSARPSDSRHGPDRRRAGGPAAGSGPGRGGSSTPSGPSSTRPASGTSWPMPRPVICRCEEVSLGRLEAALADGASSIGEVKLRTRAGMGRCQGRYCAPVIAGLLADGKAVRSTSGRSSRRALP